MFSFTLNLLDCRDCRRSILWCYLAGYTNRRKATQPSSLCFSRKNAKIVVPMIAWHVPSTVHTHCVKEASRTPPRALYMQSEWLDSGQNLSISSHIFHFRLKCSTEIWPLLPIHRNSVSALRPLWCAILACFFHISDGTKRTCDRHNSSQSYMQLPNKSTEKRNHFQVNLVRQSG